MDKNHWLIRLSEQGRFWRVDFDDLSPAEQVFRAVWDLEADVNNGGFDQYFFNGAGDTAFAVVPALESIGAERMARIAERANSVFPGSIPPRDRTQRQLLLETRPEDKHDLLRKLDEEFYRYPDDLTELLYDHVQRNGADMAGAPELAPDAHTP
jgi:hypothetical protein